MTAGEAIDAALGSAEAEMYTTKLVDGDGNGYGDGYGNGYGNGYGYGDGDGYGDGYGDGNGGGDGDEIEPALQDYAL